MTRTLAAVVVLLVPAVVSAGKPQADVPQDAEPQAVAPPPPPAPSNAKPSRKSKPAAKAMQKKVKPGAPDIPIPPSVLTGDGDLICDINSKQNGHQKLTILTGGGLEFDVAVSPIVDGTVETAGEDKGGTYRFTSHLAKAATAKLPGVGVFDLDELETKVIVEMTRYKQPAGKGTALSFTSADMARRGIYVEFAGRGHAKNGELYAFRVNLGPPIDGRGKVTPAGPEARAPMMNKMVEVRAPITTVVVTTTVDQLAEKK
jgi:hypothetical protein